MLTVDWPAVLQLPITGGIIFMVDCKNGTILVIYLSLIATSGKNKFPINHHLISVRNSYSQGHLYYSLCFINTENSAAQQLRTSAFI